MAPIARLLPPTPRLSRAVLTLALALLPATAIGPAAAQDASPAPSADPAGLPQGFDQDMVDEVAGIIESVPPLRGLAPADDVSYRVIDDETFRVELEALIREEYPDEYIAAEDAAWTRLGLLGPDQDLAELILEIYDSQVLAYYDPQEKVFSLIGPIDEVGALESVVVAHEYGHALQDARWDLEGGRVKDLDQADAILAQQALIEGDATAVMFDWAARELGVLDLVRVSASAMVDPGARVLESMPAILRRQLEFPYLDGYEFVLAVRGSRGWPAVDAVWEAQPISTEQVLHPELYPDELPVDIELPDVAAALGPGWTSSYEQTLGEMQIGVWVADGRESNSLFAALLPGQLPRAEAAAGWGGDRLMSLDGPDGAWVVVWQTEWDSAQDQAEFLEAAREAMEDLPGAHSASDADVAGGLSSPVLVSVADSDGTLAALEAALGL